MRIRLISNLWRSVLEQRTTLRPQLTNSLLGVLVRFRKERIEIMADIQKMFYSFTVREDQRNYLGFLRYRDTNFEKDLIEYCMQFQTITIHCKLCTTQNCGSGIIFIWRGRKELCSEEFLRWWCLDLLAHQRKSNWLAYQNKGCSRQDQITQVRLEWWRSHEEPTFRRSGKGLKGNQP